MDPGGNLVWQHLYYQTYTTGRPLGEYFPASALAPGGGFVATGPTENYPAQREEMFVVKTDSSGLAGSCADVHPATPLQAINPQLTAAAPALPVRAVTSPAVRAPIGAIKTAITTQTGC